MGRRALEIHPHGRKRTRPVLRHVVVEADGTHVPTERVFCGRDGKSIPLDACVTCGAFLEVTADVRGNESIVCEPPEAKTETRPPVGTLANPAPICVREDVGVRAVSRLIFERDLPFVLVVDASGKLIGLVWPKDLLRAPHPASPVAEVMTSPASAREGCSVRRTLLHMAATRMRSIPIVSEDGAPIGVLRDVDALRVWAELDDDDREG